MDPTKQYDTSFTPEGKKEASKYCTGCDRGLPANKFKMKYTTRAGVKGITRNRCCRECESRKTIKETVDVEVVEEMKRTIESQQKSINDLQIVLGSLMAKVITLEAKLA